MLGMVHGTLRHAPVGGLRSMNVDVDVEDNNIRVSEIVVIFENCSRGFGVDSPKRITQAIGFRYCSGRVAQCNNNATYLEL